jgi:hypothetical protein
MKTVFALAALVVLAGLVDRLALWAEARGWIYWRRNRPRGSAGNVLLDLNVFEPGVRHVIDAKQAEPTMETSSDEILPPLRSAAPIGAADTKGREAPAGS